MNSYPLIIQPDYVRLLKGQKVPMPEKPKHPISPLNTISVLIPLGFLLLLFGLVNSIFIFLGIVSVLFGWAQKRRNKVKHESKLKEYQTLLNEYYIADKEYNNALDNYEILNKETKHSQLKNKLSELQRLHFGYVTNISGHREEFFLNALRATNLNIEISRSVGMYSYVPDFILRKGGILIDIEIDEPYVKDTKEPIHYIGKDTYRNSYFASKGFYIIRFAEEQIVNNCSECISLIKEVLFYAENMPFDEINYKFAGNIVGFWTKEQAINFAQRNYRDNYLSNQ